MNNSPKSNLDFKSMNIKVITENNKLIKIKSIQSNLDQTGITIIIELPKSNRKQIDILEDINLNFKTFIDFFSKLKEDK